MAAITPLASPPRAAVPSGAAERPMGLRERKKLRTRVAIRRATYRLIAEQGYEAATVEQIAEAAEVSPSTVFRYFPAKEDIVLSDEYDARLDAELRARPAGEDPLDSMRHVLCAALARAVAEAPDEVAQRTRLMAEVPALRARMTESLAATSELLIRALADRTGRSPDDLGVRVFTAAVLGAVREAMLHWAADSRREEPADPAGLPGLADRALRMLGDGMRLRTPR